MASDPPFSELSALAARPFASREESIGAVLDLIYRVVGLRTPLLARTNHGRFEVQAVKSFGGCPIQVGDTLPLEDSY